MEETTVEETLAEIKKAFKTEQWFFFNKIINGREVYIKLFPGKTEVDLQIFRINGIYHNIAFNYGRKKRTLDAIKEQLERLS